MPNSLDNRKLQLISYLERLIEIMRRNQSPTWDLLVKAVDGKSAYVGLDDIYLFLSASGGRQLKVKIEIAEKIENPNFYTRGQVLRNIIAGKYILDKAINDRHLYVRGSLEDLLAMHHLVLNALVDGNINREYLELWLDFETNWKTGPKENNCWKLEDQLPKYRKRTFISK